MNWALVIPIGVAALIIVALLAWKNLKDEKKIVENMKQDYPKSKDEEGDTEIEDVMK